jgi:hypothetical protein
MKKILPILVLILLGCDKEFEPELTGWKAFTVPGRRIFFELDGREALIELPGNESIAYRFAQWTKLQDHILLAQMTKTKSCYDFQIISIDTTGTILDTIYTAPPDTPVNFKLAPNDSLLLLKTYSDNCTDEGSDYKYTFYNRYLKTSLPDTIKVANARGILLPETVWSPDSKKVIIPEWSVQRTKATVYDLVTKRKTYIETGDNFIWSPTDNNVVAYIKDYSIYTMNIETGEKEIIFKGKKKKRATAFRWNPSGDFLMIHVQGYLLNLEAGPFQTHNTIYISMKDGNESKVFYEDERIDTWKDK